MLKTIQSFLKKYWPKLTLTLILLLTTLVFERVRFTEVESIIIDSLQNLNTSPPKYKNEIKTINISPDAPEKNYPLNFNKIKSVIEKIESQNPKLILLAIEPADIVSLNKEREKLFNYLSLKPNVYINALDSSTGKSSFKDIEKFKHFPRLLYLFVTKDIYFGSQDGNTRRAIISFDNGGPVGIFKLFNSLNISNTNETNFKFHFEYLNTKQVFMKRYPSHVFGNYDLKNLKTTNINFESLKDCIVVLGVENEFTFLSQIFSPGIFDSPKENAEKKITPYHQVVANLLNLYINGDYIKVRNFPLDWTLFVLLLFLILIRKPYKTKLFIFMCIIPALIFTQVSLYFFYNIYIDFSRSIMMLAAIQYFFIPLMVHLIFKKQEEHKLQAITNARIDALLAVSEKVAHDIRSPLSALNLVINRVKFNNEEEKEIFKNSLKRIDSTAENILQKYKTTEPGSITYENLDLSEILTRIIAEKKLLAPTITFMLNTKNLNKHSLGYQLEFERVLSNIVDNSIFALKNKNEAKIEISAYTKDNLNQLIIADNGDGIPKNILNILGLKRVTTKINSGNGIGLLHAKRSIENMGGLWQITSTESSGTIVSITLPVA